MTIDMKFTEFRVIALKSMRSLSKEGARPALSADEISHWRRREGTPLKGRTQPAGDMIMAFRLGIAMWLSALQQKVIAQRSRARITGGVEYYSPVLDDEVGEIVGCWRLSGERDRDYQHRLAIHISEKIAALAALEQRLLDHDRRTAP